LASLMGNPEITDDQYIEEFNLDPSVANTPMINQVMLDKVEEQNINYYIQEGNSEEQAMKKAADFRNQTEKTIKQRLAAKGLL